MTNQILDIHSPSIDARLEGLDIRYRQVTAEGIEALLAEDGLSVGARTGVRVNPLTRAFSLQRGMAVNYMLCATRPEDGGRAVSDVEAAGSVQGPTADA